MLEIQKLRCRWSWPIQGLSERGAVSVSTNFLGCSPRGGRHPLFVHPGDLRPWPLAPPWCLWWTWSVSGRRPSAMWSSVVCDGFGSLRKKSVLRKQMNFVPLDESAPTDRVKGKWGENMLFLLVYESLKFQATLFKVLTVFLWCKW